MFQSVIFANLLNPGFRSGITWPVILRGMVKWIALIGLSYILIGSIASSAVSLLLVVLSLLLLILALHDEYRVLVIVMSLAFYSSYLIKQLSLPSTYLMLPNILIFLLLARRIVECILTRRSFARAPVNSIILSLFIFMLVSFGLNSNPLPAALKGTINHLTYVTLFLVITNSNLSDSSLKKMVVGILLVALVQIPASIIQYYFIYADYPIGLRHDFSAGLLGYSSGGINAVFMTFILSLLFGLMLTFGLRARFLISAVALSIPIILSSARAGLLFFMITPLFLTTLMLFSKKRKRVAVFLLSSMAIVLIGVGLSVLSNSGDISFVTNPSAIYEYSIKTADGGLGRLQSLQFVHENLTKSMLRSFVGFGPGAITPTSFLGSDRNSFYQENDLLSHYNDYAYLTLELGYGGLFLFLLLLYKLFALSRNFYRECDNNFWKAVSFGLMGIIFTTGYSIIYTRGFTYPALAFSLWLLAGAITRIAYLNGYSRKLTMS